MTKTVCFATLLLFSTFLLLAQAEETTSPSKQTVHLDAQGDPLPDNVLLSFGTSRFRYPSSVAEIAVSPDGKSVVSIGSEWLIVWDAETGQERWRVSGAEGNFRLVAASYGLRSIAFAPDGKHFYAPGKPGEVVLWDLQSGEHETITLGASLPKLANLKIIIFGQNVTRSVDVTSDGQHMAVGSDRGLVICDSQGEVLHKIVNAPAKLVTPDDMNRDRLNFAGDYSYGVFSPDGKQLAAVLSEAPKEIRLLATTTGEELRRIPLADKLVRLDFSPDGQHIATTERDCSARLYAVETREEVWAYEIPPARAESYTSALTFSPDGQTVAVCAPIGSDFAIYLLDALTGKMRLKLNGHRWKPWAVAFSPDGDILYSSGWDGNIRRWDPQTGKQLPLPVGVCASGTVTTSPVAPLIAYEDDAGTIHLVNSRDGAELRSLSLPETNFDQIAFSSDGTYIAAGGTHKNLVRVVAWELKSTRHVVWQWPKGSDEHSGVDALQFSPDSQKLAAAVFRQSAGYLWDLNTFKQTAKLDHRRIYGLSFSPDSKSLVTVGWNSVIQSWDTETGQMQSTTLASDGNDAVSTSPNLMSGDDLRMYGVDHSADGSLIATAHMNSTIRVWQADGMRCRLRFAVDGSFSYDVIRFSPDGLWLATGSAGGRVSLWDPRTGKKAWSAKNHQDNVFNLEFGRNSGELVSGADDGSVFWWDLHPKAKLPDHKPEPLWEILAYGNQAYQAMATLVESPDSTIPLLREKLRPVTTLVDLEYAAPDLSTEEVEQQHVKNEIAVGGDLSKESDVVVARALAVLEQINSPAAKELLQELANRNPKDDVSRRAAIVLKRLGKSQR